MSQDIVKQIRKATRRQFTAEEKIRIVLEGLRGEVPVSPLECPSCDREIKTSKVNKRITISFISLIGRCYR
jgi:hypothetical protein